MIYYDYSHSQIQYFADELNKRYNPERLTKAMPVDVFDIVDLLGARLAIDYLSPDRTYLGATTFADGTLWIWPGNPFTSDMRPEKKSYKKGTIIIDADLDTGDSQQDRFTKNYTVIHECFHFSKHEPCFRHHAHLSKSADDYRKGQSQTNSALYKIERQANYAAAAFLMPEDAIKNAFREYCSGEPFPFCYDVKSIIREIGEQFGVNYTPVVYRLQELGLLEQHFDSQISFT